MSSQLRLRSGDLDLELAFEYANLPESEEREESEKEAAKIEPRMGGHGIVQLYGPFSEGSHAIFNPTPINTAHVSLTSASPGRSTSLQGGISPLVFISFSSLGQSPAVSAGGSRGAASEKHARALESAED